MACGSATRDSGPTPAASRFRNPIGRQPLPASFSRDPRSGIGRRFMGCPIAPRGGAVSLRSPVPHWAAHDMRRPSACASRPTRQRPWCYRAEPRPRFSPPTSPPKYGEPRFTVRQRVSLLRLAANPRRRWRPGWPAERQLRLRGREPITSQLPPRRHLSPNRPVALSLFARLRSSCTGCVPTIRSE